MDARRAANLAAQALDEAGLPSAAWMFREAIERAAAGGGDELLNLYGALAMLAARLSDELRKAEHR